MVVIPSLPSHWGKIIFILPLELSEALRSQAACLESRDWHGGGVDSKCFLVPSSLHSRHGILSNFIWIPNTNQQNFVNKWSFQVKPQTQPQKYLLPQKEAVVNLHYGFHLFPGSWRRKPITKAMGCLQGAVCNHYLETDGQLCKKNLLQLISFF